MTINCVSIRGKASADIEHVLKEGCPFCLFRIRQVAEILATMNGARA